MNQIEKILEITGMPSTNHVDEMDSPFAEIMLANVSLFEKVSLSSLVLGGHRHRRHGANMAINSEEAIDLIQQMMKFDPNERYSAELALAHRYVSDFYNPRHERSFAGPMKVSQQHTINYFVTRAHHSNSSYMASIIFVRLCVCVFFFYFDNSDSFG